jgi:hypothetical protein
MMDAVARAYKTVRDATLLNKDLSTAEAIALLETVKAEALEVTLRKLRDEAMNT